MEKRTINLTALGLLVIVAGVLFVWGLFYLMGNPIWRGRTDVALVLENGGGLKRGDRVHLNGVQVGTVRDVRLEGPEVVHVDLRLDEGLLLPADTRARLRTDMFGSNTVDLLPGTALVRLEKGDTIHGLPTQGLPELVSDLSARTQSVLTSADSLLSPQAVSDMHATAAVLPATAQEMLAAFSELHRAAAALRRTAEGVEGAEAGPAFTQALQELQGSAQAFTSAANAMEQSLGAMASVMSKIDQGDGTLGRLVNDTTLYAEMHGALREVRLLATDFRERPKRYVDFSIF